MAQHLTNSLISRGNILNNPFALSQIEENLQLGGFIFEEERLFTKQQIAQVLEIDERTIDRYINNFSDELKQNGYRIFRGGTLKRLRLTYVDDINVVDISPKTP